MYLYLYLNTILKVFFIKLLNKLRFKIMLNALIAWNFKFSIVQYFSNFVIKKIFKFRDIFTKLKGKCSLNVLIGDTEYFDLSPIYLVD